MKLPVIFLIAFTPVTALSENVDIQPIPDLPLNIVPFPPAKETAQPEGVWRVSLGGGISYAPRYEGAKNDRLRFIPLVEASYSNGKFFVSPLRGVGYNFSDEKDVQYGARLVPGHGRRQSADPRLNGMGDIGFTPEAGLFFNRRFAPWYVSSGITTGRHGVHAELGGGIGVPVSATDRVRLGVSLIWGDARYNQTYFGITPAQAAASGNVLTAYDASAGIKDYALTANWAHSYNKERFSSAGLSYMWLRGSAQHSPLTQRSSAGRVNFLLGYRF